MSQVTDGSVSPASPNPFKATPAPPVKDLSRPDVLGSIGPATTVVVTPRTPTNLSREQILDATDVCLQELGYDGTTIRRIAKELGCAVGSIYRYFDDKRALLTAVVQRRFEPVTERIGQGAPIDAVANLYSQIAAEQPELYRLMFWLSSIGKTTHTNTLPQIIREVVDGWAEQLGDRRAAEGYWSQLHGSIMHGRRADDLPLPTVAPAPGTPQD
ncbi:MAG: TetR/AcrR family transcriptional regulator [Planctomycetota bacterium]